MISGNHKKMVVFFILGFFIGLSIGYIWGFGDAITWTANKAVEIFKIGEWVTSEQLAKDLIMYRQKVGL